MASKFKIVMLRIFYGHIFRTLLLIKCCEFSSFFYMQILFAEFLLALRIFQWIYGFFSLFQYYAYPSESKSAFRVPPKLN